MTMQITQRKMRGFTIIELMVAITISALILGVLTQVYAGTKRSYRVAEALSRMQENGRYAMDYVARDIRLAGYTGCVSGGTTVNNMANPITGWSPLNTATSPITLQGIEGYEASSVTYSGISTSLGTKTDALLIQYLSPSSAKLINPGPQNANMQINGNPLNFQQYEILVVTDCAFADIFKATSVSSSSGTVTIAHSNSNNTGNNTSHPYEDNAEVMRMQSNVYYIDTGAYGGPSLMRRRLGFFGNGDATRSCTNAASSVTQGFCVEEIAEGVEDLQVLYGVDTNTDLSADKFVAASSVVAADWPKVVSVRVNLLVRSVETNVSPESNTTAPTSQIPLFNNDTAYTTTTLSATPRAFRRVYTDTIVLRNRAL